MAQPGPLPWHVVVAVTMVIGVLAAGAMIALDQSATRTRLEATLLNRVSADATFTESAVRAAQQHAHDEGPLLDAILDDYLTRSTVTPNSATWLVDEDGRVVAFGADRNPPPAVAVSGERPVPLTRDGVPHVAAVAPVAGTSWNVVAVAPRGELFGPVAGWDRLRPWLLLAMAATLGAFTVLLLRRDAQARARLVRANLELEEAASQTRDFVAIASHELRTPVAIISGYAEGAAESWDELTPEERHHDAERLVLASRRLSHLLDALLLQAVADRRQLPVALDDVRLAPVVRSAVASSFLDAGEVEVDVDAELVAVADEAHLTRILLNLLDNAARYGAPPIEVTGTARGGWVTIEVRDHGEGVPAAFTPRLFERFARAEPMSGGPDRGGAGLGLSVARGIAEQMGGTLVYEPDDRGTRFVLTLPAA